MRPASMRPITGMGKPRKRRASASTAPPEREPIGRIASAVLGSNETGRAPLPIWLRVSARATSPISASASIAAESSAVAERPDLAGWTRQQAKRREARRQPIRIGIKPQHRFERGQAGLVETQGALQRVAGELLDEVGAPDDEPGLRAAQQFVAAEGDEIGSLVQRLRYRRLVRQPPALEIDERAAAQILDERDRMVARQRGEPPRRHRGGEAPDRVIAGMRLEDQAGLRPDRRLVVGEMRSVGRADLAQPASRPGS